MNRAFSTFTMRLFACSLGALAAGSLVHHTSWTHQPVNQEEVGVEPGALIDLNLPILANRGETHTLVNGPSGLIAKVNSDGLLCTSLNDPLAWSVSIVLERIGRGNDWAIPITTPEVEADEHRVLARHGAFDLEHVSSEEGVRQNFIVHEQPEGAGPLRVELRPDGNLTCAHVADDVFLFTDTTGVVRMSYSDLHVWDAKGDTLKAAAFQEDGLIVLEVNDTNAEFPIVIDPISATAVWSMESNLASARLGTSVASAGDVNGDGYSDILVGTPVWSNGETGEGRVQLHLGSAAGPSATISWSFETDQLGANLGLGRSVSTAGDVNGDGFSDIIVGAPYFDNGETNEGRVFVFHGSASGLPTTPNWTAESDQAASLFGYVVNCAGDVNGDGFSDVVVGAYQFDNGQTDEGRVLVYHGSAIGLSVTASWTTESDQAYARFGYSTASAGDVNGDGFSDLIVGAPLFDNGQSGEGRAFVYRGSAAGLMPTPIWTTESNQGASQTGFSVSSAGDVNNDGYSDVAVGIPFYASSFANDGRVVVHLGSAAGVAAIAGWTYDSPTQEAQLGKVVACAGDVNGDGFGDLMVGAPEHTNSQAEEGKVYTFFGNTIANMTLDWQSESNQAGARYGTAVASAGDVNGDGFSDVLVGAPEWDNGQTNEGLMRCFLGSAEAIRTVPDQTITGASSLGRSVNAAGDVNGDGYGDVIVGAPFSQRAFVYHGSAIGLSGFPDWSYFHAAAGNFGISLAGAGDVNGDGYSDVIIGSETANRVHVHYGSPTGLAVAPSWVAVGPTPNTWFGSSVASAGDVNADGYADVIIGEPRYQTGSGRAHVFHGGPTGLSSTSSWVATPFAAPLVANANFGEGVDGAGDVNGDGYSDVIIGAGGYSGERGRVLVYHGGPTGLGAAAASVFDQPTALWRLGSNTHGGSSVSSAGDVNADGYSDVIMATMGHNIFVHHGGPAGLSAAPNYTAPTPGGPFYGATVSSAGDVNGDGYSDVIVSDCNAGGLVYLGGRWGLGGPIFGSPITTPNITHPGSGSHSASGAGDVNGDGYGDVIVGIYPSNHFKLCKGNWSVSNSRGNLRLYNTDMVSPVNASNIPIPQFGAGLFTRAFLGHTKTRLVWETRIQGQAFSTATNGLVTNSVASTAAQPTPTNGLVLGVELKNLVDKPGGGTGLTATKVRARVRFDPATAITGQVFGPWRYMPGYLDGSGTHNNVPLPVELLYFKATCDRGQVSLEWSTASETNSDRFVVQRSPDAEHWHDLDVIDAAGNSQQVIDYSYIDERPMSNGSSYYRLLQVDDIGQENELPIVAVPGCGAAERMTVFPNPARAQFFVNIPSGIGNTALLLEVRDALGRSALTTQVPTHTLVLEVDSRSLGEGWYTVAVLDRQGALLDQTRLVVQR